MHDSIQDPDELTTYQYPAGPDTRFNMYAVILAAMNHTTEVCMVCLPCFTSERTAVLGP